MCVCIYFHLENPSGWRTGSSTRSQRGPCPPGKKTASYPSGAQCHPPLGPS